MNEEAGFWIRLAAWELDALIVSLPISILFGILTGDFENEPISNFLLALYGILLPAYWNGYTIGKRICGIRIRKYDTLDPPGIGTMLLRNVVAGLVYMLTFGIAFIISVLMVACREDKCAVHDFIAGTEVVRG